MKPAAMANDHQLLVVSIVRMPAATVTAMAAAGGAVAGGLAGAGRGHRCLP
jgi:hypothetical protein